MTTYSDHEQRELDAASGAEMDKQAAKPVEAVRILRLLISMHAPHPDALELLQQALAAEYARGRVDGAQEMGDRLSAQRHNIGPAGLSGNSLGGTP